VSLAYLWQRDQHELLEGMVASEVDAILVKVAAAGLGARHIGQPIHAVRPHLEAMHHKYGLNVCGEGGEYETLTRDCPLFKSKVLIDALEPVVDTDDRVAPIVYARVTGVRLVPKTPAELLAQAGHLAPYPAVPPAAAPVPPPPLDMALDLPAVDMEGEEDEGSVHTHAHTHTVRDGYVFVEGLTCAGHAGSVADEMRGVIAALDRVLATHGAALGAVLRVVLVLADLADFAAVNGAYIAAFTHSPPSRVCIQGRVTAPARIQLHAVAYTAGPRDALHVQSVSRWAPPNIGPYSQAVRADGLVHIAGQIALDPATVTLKGADAHAQAELALTHVDHVARAMQAQAQDMHGVRSAALTVCYAVDPADIAAAQTVYAQRGAGGEAIYMCVPWLPRGARVEWEVLCTAAREGHVAHLATAVATGPTIPAAARALRGVIQDTGGQLVAVRAYACTDTPAAATRGMRMRMPASTPPYFIHSLSGLPRPG
jgi:diphthine-ammonia ligase